MRARVLSPSVLEALLTSREAFGLEQATPLQRAICRVSDGVPLGELWEDAGVREGFGGVRPLEKAPRTLVVLAAIRGAKSMIAAAKAFETALTCDVTGLSPGDQLRIPILSVDKKSATAVLNHLVGTIQSKPELRAYLAAEPTAEAVLLRHETGRIVEVSVTAMSKYGTTLVGAWLATCIFDEAPRMAGHADGVRNLDDALHAIEGRMRPGSQIMIIGSPNVPFGPVFEMNQEFFGRPSADTVVVRGTGPLLNPTWWTPERCEWMRRNRPRSHMTDVLGKFADSEDQLISSTTVDKAMRAGPDVIKPREGHSYVAAIDPAMRGNAWTLIILGCDGEDRKGEPTFYVAVSKQWRGSKVQPLRPDTVLREIAQIAKPYGVEDAWTDGFSIDSLRIIAEQEGFGLTECHTTPEEAIDGVESMRVLLEDGRLELSPDRTLRADLLRVRRSAGKTAKRPSLNMPITADGRHCDFIPPLRLCLRFPPGTPRAAARQRDPGLEAALRGVAARQDRANLPLGLFRGGLNG